MIFFDTETVGLQGPIVLLQWAEDDDDVNLEDLWMMTVGEIIDLLEYIASKPVCGFNLVFDWFHVCQMYTTLLLMDRSSKLLGCIDQYADLEPLARNGPCLKPLSACDIMLHARKGEYQTTMDRKDIIIKKVPTQLAHPLANELGKRIILKDIYFAKKQDKTERWKVYETKDPNFKNVVLKFAPSSKLKALASDALNVDAVMFDEIALPRSASPVELGFAPFAKAVSTDAKAWPDIIERHMEHWYFNSEARKYAENDVVYTRDLYKYFGSPEPGDTDSILACMVGAVRWKGFSIDKQKMKNFRKKRLQLINSIKNKVSFNSAAKCRAYIAEVMSETEKLIIADTTKSAILEEICKWRIADTCAKCNGFGCDCCQDGLIDTDKIHPAAERASEIITARKYKKELEIYDKILLAGRFHASLKVIGTLSSRMSGSDSLNAQGIRKTEEVRSMFTLSDEGYTLCGGDFDMFEVSIMDAIYKDPKMREDLDSGKSLHGVFGTLLYPPLTYEEIAATKGTANDLYTKSKSGIFALSYGGNAYTLHTRLGVSEDDAERATIGFFRRYNTMGAKRKEISDMFCSMKQPNGIGTKVEWSDPPEYIESIFGFRRYFTLENKICKVLFDLAEKPPKEWLDFKIKVTRRDREQTTVGAVRSALFAAAFAQQAYNMRAAGNHVIQSPGATETKQLQREIWDLQPAGKHEWVVQPLNIHDEIMCPVKIGYEEVVKNVVNNHIEKMREVIPRLGMDWKIGLKTWANK